MNKLGSSRPSNYSSKCRSTPANWEAKLHVSRTLLLLCFLFLGSSAFAQTTLTPATMSFGNQAVSVASVPKTATFENTQSVPLAISSIVSSGTAAADYAWGGNCPISPSTLGAGRSCSITVTFTPSALGSRSASLKITDSASTSPQSISLTGTGVDPVTVLPTSLTFASLLVGTASAAQTVTLTNGLKTELAISTVATGGDFTVSSNGCGSSVGAGAKCTIGVTFTPTAVGARNGTLTVNDSAFGSPNLVKLSGTGNDTGLTAITVTPANSSIVQGNTQEFTATGHFKSGSTENLTAFVAWSSSKPNVATIIPGGLATGVTSGGSQAPNWIIYPTCGTTPCGLPNPIAVEGTHYPTNLSLGTAATPYRRNWTHMVYIPSLGEMLIKLGGPDCCSSTINNAFWWLNDNLSNNPSVSGASSAWQLAWSNMLAANSDQPFSVNSCNRTGSTQIVVCSINISTDGGTQQFYDLTPTIGGNNFVANSVDPSGTITPMGVVLWGKGKSGAAGCAATLVGAGGTCFGNKYSVDSTQWSAEYVQLCLQGSLSAPSYAPTCLIPGDGPSAAYMHNTSFGTPACSGGGPYATPCGTYTISYLDTTAAASTTDTLIGVTNGSPCEDITTTTNTCWGGPFEAPNIEEPHHPYHMWTYDDTDGVVLSFGGAAEGTGFGGGTGDQAFCSDCATSNLTKFTISGANIDPTEICGELSQVDSLNSPYGPNGIKPCTDASAYETSPPSSAITPPYFGTHYPQPDTEAAVVWDDCNNQLILAGGTSNATDSFTFNLSTKVWQEQTGAWNAWHINSPATVTHTREGMIWVNTDGLGHHQCAVYMFYGGSNATITVNQVFKGIPAAGGATIDWELLTLTGSTPEADLFPVVDLDPDATSSCPNGYCIIYITQNQSPTASNQLWQFDPSVYASCSASNKSACTSPSANAWTELSTSNVGPTLATGGAECEGAPGACHNEGGFNRNTHTFDLMIAGGTEQQNVVAYLNIPANGFKGTASTSSISAMLGSITGSTTLTVTAPVVLVSIALTPANSSIAAGTAQQFTATGTYSDGSTQDLTSTATWSSSALGVATIISGGVATGVTTGISSISATLGSITSSATLTVTAPVLVSIAVTPASPSIAAGVTQQLTAIGTYGNGSTVNLTSTVTWTSSSTGVATISNASGSQGLVTATGAGTTTIEATSGSVSGFTILTVTNPALVEQVNANNSILVQENSDPLQVSGIAQRVVVGNPLVVTAVTVQFQNTSPKSGYAYIDLVNDDGTGNPSNQSAGILGTSTNLYPGVNGGSFTFNMPAVAVPAGTFYVVVRTQNVSVNADSACLIVTGRTAAPATMAPAQVQDPTTLNWSVAAPQQFLTFSLTGLSTASTSLTSIVVTPATPAVSVGSTQQLAALGVYADGTMQDLTNSATWNSSNPSAATVNGSGLANGSAAGTSTISASSGSSSGSTAVTVGSPLTVQQTNSGSSILVQQGSNPLLVSGIGQPLTLTASIIINSVTVQLSNVSYNEGYAYVDIVKDDGTGKPSNSSTDIIATSVTQVWELESGTYAFDFLPTVVPGALFHIVLRTQNVGAVSNSSLTVTTGSTSALPGLNGILTQDPSTQVWSAASPIQYLTFTLSGLTTTGAAFDGLTSITVAPASASASVGQTQQFSATGTYVDGSTTDLSSAAVWNSSNTSAATISNAGLANGVAVGTTNITASLEGITSNSATLTVGPPALISIGVTPANGTVPAGLSVQFCATGTYTDGSTQNLTSSAMWSSGAPIATINSAGLASGLIVGMTTITATSGAVQGMATLTVTSPVLASIAVTPVDASIPLSSTQQFTATGTYSDGTTQNLTSTAAWASSAGNVATISTTGLASAVGLGQTTVQATSDAINSSTSLTVTAGFALNGSLNNARYRHTATLLNDGTVLITGGETSPGNALNTAELYNPTTGMFSLTNGTLNNARYAHTATLLNDGTVLITGGETSPGNALNIAELYDPTTGMFSLTNGTLNNARYAHTATLLNDGTVLITGGYGSGGYLASAELYGPVAQSFTLTGSLNTARDQHTSTVLNGTVLIVGGYNGSALASAEMYYSQ
jgi:hypothetical protein